MAKTKISEFSSTAADNTDITNINIAEGCSPANVNNAIRSLMSVLKNQQDGSSGDPFTVAGTFNATGGFQLDGTAGASGQVLLSAGGSNTPTWGNAFVAGMIMLWSGSSASIPSGWLLCDGTNSTPDLRNRFVVGAGSTYAVNATGGSADAIVVSHTHTITDPGHAHVYTTLGRFTDTDRGNGSSLWSIDEVTNYNTSSVGTGISINSTGSSGTNANLPPYYALCYIMKS
jgi:hypothetical protein